MKYISECCKAETIIRNNDIGLCSKCHEECDVLEIWDLSQTPTQKNLSEILAITFDGDAMMGNFFGQSLREHTLIGLLVNQY